VKRGFYMRVTVDIDEGLIADVDQAADVQNVSRDAAFREALETWVAHKPKSVGWSMDYSTLEFDPDFVLRVDRPGPEALAADLLP
jgi:Arc/MetJ family transcription regulator